MCVSSTDQRSLMMDFEERIVIDVLALRILACMQFSFLVEALVLDTYVMLIRHV